MTTETKPKTHLVAIVRVVDQYYNDGDGYDTVAQSISDWEEVDNETFKLLKQASTYRADYVNDNRFIVLERLKTDSPTVINTVDAYVKHVAKQKAAQEAAAATRQATAEDRRLKKLAKDEKARLALFEKLQKEFGDKQ